MVSARGRCQRSCKSKAVFLCSFGVLSYQPYFTYVKSTSSEWEKLYVFIGGGHVDRLVKSFKKINPNPKTFILANQECL